MLTTVRGSYWFLLVWRADTTVMRMLAAATTQALAEQASVLQEPPPSSVSPLGMKSHRCVSVSRTDPKAGQQAQPVMGEGSCYV